MKKRFTFYYTSTPSSHKKSTLRIFEARRRGIALLWKGDVFLDTAYINVVLWLHQYRRFRVDATNTRLLSDAVQIVDLNELKKERL